MVNRSSSDNSRNGPLCCNLDFWAETGPGFCAACRPSRSRPWSNEDIRFGVQAAQFRFGVCSLGLRSKVQGQICMGWGFVSGFAVSSMFLAGPGAASSWAWCSLHFLSLPLSLSLFLSLSLSIHAPLCPFQQWRERGGRGERGEGRGERGEGEGEAT